MKNIRKICLSLLILATILAGFTSNAFALTAACLPVTNQAELAYTVGGVGQTNIFSDGDAAAGVQTTDFTVETLVDLTVATANSPVSATGVNQALIFTVTNLGNDAQDYDLVLYNAATAETFDTVTDNFDMTNVRVYVDYTPDGTYDGDETLLNGAPTFGSSLGEATDIAGDIGGADPNSFDVIVLSNVPSGQATNDVALYSLKAFTHQRDGEAGSAGADSETGNTATDGVTTNSCGNNVVLGDGDADTTVITAGVGGVSDGVEDGDHYATGYYIVSAANITVSKSVTILWDPINGSVAPQYIPGAYVTYAVTISNAGAAAAVLTTISDPLSASLNLDPGFFDGTDLDPSDGPYGSGSATDGIRVASGGTSTRATATTPTYHSGDSATDTDNDGVAYTLGAGGTLTIDFSGANISATSSAVLPAEGAGTYAAGELKGGENVTVTFNAIIQ